MHPFAPSSARNISSGKTELVLLLLFLLCPIERSKSGNNSEYLLFGDDDFSETKTDENENSLCFKISSRKTTFDWKRLCVSGDVHVHPGPTSVGAQGKVKPTRLIRFPCQQCGRGVTARSRAVSCDGCEGWTHVNCTGGEVTRERYDSLSTAGVDFAFNCNRCSLTHDFSTLPFHDDDDNESVFRIGDGSNATVVDESGGVGGGRDDERQGPVQCRDQLRRQKSSEI